MKTRELFLGEKQGILKLRKEGKSYSIGDSLYSNLECLEKERNHCHTEQDIEQVNQGKQQLMTATLWDL